MRLSLESLLSSRTRSGWAAFHALAFASFSALRVSGVGVWSFIMRSWSWVLFSAMWAGANEGQLSLWASEASGTRLTLYGFCRRPASGDTVGDCAALYARLGAPLVEGEGFGSDGHPISPVRLRRFTPALRSLFSCRHLAHIVSLSRLVLPHTVH